MVFHLKYDASLTRGVGIARIGPSFSPILTCIHLAEAALSNIDDLPVHRDPENLPEPITSWRTLDKVQK